MPAGTILMARWHISLLASALLALACGDVGAAGEPLRIGITGVLVEHNRALNEQMITYIGEKVGRPVEILHRKSYQEMSDLLERGLADAAFVCGLPYVIDREKFGEELLVSPVFNGKPLYQSYVIVPRDSDAKTLEDLRGKLYAFSDPLSNSGKLVPTYRLVTLGETPENFFRRYIFTYSHSANVEAVAAYDPTLHGIIFHRLMGVLSEKASRLFRSEEQEVLHEEVIDTGLAKIYRSYLEVARRVAADQGIHLTITLLVGKAFEAIIRHTRNLQPWLLVLGRVGFHSDEELDIGSTSENLLRLAPCHVLLASRKFYPPMDVKAETAVA